MILNAGVFESSGYQQYLVFDGRLIRLICTTYFPYPYAHLPFRPQLLWSALPFLLTALSRTPFNMANELPFSFPFNLDSLVSPSPVPSKLALIFSGLGVRLRTSPVICDANAAFVRPDSVRSVAGSGVDTRGMR